MHGRNTWFRTEFSESSDQAPCDVPAIGAPASSYHSLWGLPLSGTQAALIGWFGVRGAGSVFYLAYATAHGLDPSSVTTIANVVLPTVALSVVVHGISVTPFMLAYSQRRGQRSVT